MINKTRLCTLAGAALLLWTTTAEAQASFKTGSFLKTTTTGASVAQVVPHGLGETPKAIIFWMSANTAGVFYTNQIFALGMADGTTSFTSSAASQQGQATSLTSRRIATRRSRSTCGARRS